MRNITIYILLMCLLSCNKKADTEKRLLEMKISTVTLMNAEDNQVEKERITVESISDNYFNTVLTEYLNDEYGLYYKASYFSRIDKKHDTLFTELKVLVDIDSSELIFEGEADFLNFMDSLDYKPIDRVGSQHKTQFNFKRK